MDQDPKERIKAERRAALNAACDLVGGEAKLGELLGKSRSHVSTWKLRGMIPAEMAIPIERVSGVPRHVLRPDLYPVEEAST
ncbi:YdaS family helix-turn-helix protein [Mesorhizobium sp.]|uniref:transcriptional regulator n=1 Tax=Mesorhizobium sp. TaxID=1871066 RepID=UPI000FE6399E|nr:YdaS family helix-turn-helix protein [Mesorhizobium sp.]RWF02965.1 MAG: cytoplasmic chaperone TorD [Mesorhizobium sp.]TIW37975.1 MAG: helix-turn-helix domain-containing protein [Mesorhizobium sp.]